MNEQEVRDSLHAALGDKGRSLDKATVTLVENFIRAHFDVLDADAVIKRERSDIQKAKDDLTALDDKIAVFNEQIGKMPPIDRRVMWFIPMTSFGPMVGMQFYLSNALAVNPLIAWIGSFIVFYGIYFFAGRQLHKAAVSEIGSRKGNTFALLTVMLAAIDITVSIGGIWLGSQITRAGFSVGLLMIPTASLILTLLGVLFAWSDVAHHKGEARRYMAAINQRSANARIHKAFESRENMQAKAAELAGEIATKERRLKKAQSRLDKLRACLSDCTKKFNILLHAEILIKPEKKPVPPQQYENPRSTIDFSDVKFNFDDEEEEEKI